MVSRWEQEVGELGLNSEEFITFTWKMYEPSVKLQVKWHDRLDSMGYNQSMGTTLKSELSHLMLYKDG